VTHVKINPLLAMTAAPPIPAAKRWVASYSGALGPLIDLSQAVPGYPPHPHLLERHAAAAASGDTASYGDILGDRELRTAYAGHVTGIYGGPVSEADIAITAGCNEAFFVAMIALAKAGDRVILPSPWYFNHRMTLDMLGIEAAALPCPPETGFVPSAEAAERLIDPRTRAVVLVTPNNPTGAIYPAETIHAFAGLCRRRGIALVIDETYRDFIGRGNPRPHDLLRDPSWRETVIQLYSFSKAYCVPGYRIGAALADGPVLAEAAKILDCMQICPGRAPQRALAWAVDALASWRDDNTEIILDRASAFTQAIAGAAGWSIGSIGAYFAYLRHPFGGRPAALVAEWLARERGVLCLPGSYFGAAQDDYLRIAFANVDKATILQLPERLNAGPP
jgi:aspartate/methionine/tyrosine aminotransferase